MNLHSIFYIICLLLLSFSSYTQETCGSAIPLALNVTVNADNTGSTTDFDYSTQTGCDATNYTSSVWYSFTTPFGVGSMNVTYTGTGIGPSGTITIVDDCISETSNTFLWYECDASSISSNTTTICGLEPSSVYYIQISSDIVDEGTFDLLVEINTAAPPNDLCTGANPVFDDGIADCGDWEFIMSNVSNACPDPEASNICMQDTDPAVWHYFTIPDPVPYNAISINPVGVHFDLFISYSGCDDLTYVDCNGFLFLIVEPGATYYFLSDETITASVFTSVDGSSCTGPLQDLNTGSGIGGSDFGNNSCSEGSATVPCMNEGIDWYEYTSGCMVSDITISVEPWQTDVGGEATDTGLAVLSDCNTLLPDYDPNGLGYVCSTIINDEELIMTGVPPNTTFTIAMGSDYNFTGYYNIYVDETSGSGGSFNDICSSAEVINVGLIEDLGNICSTSDVAVSGCPPQGQATVWYEYTTAPGDHDVSVEILSTGIGSTSIAIFDACNGGLLGTVCGTNLIIPCVSGTIYIQVGSTSAATGTYDMILATSGAEALSGIDATPTAICSGSSTDLLITLLDGATGDISVSIDPSSDPSISGQQMHVYEDVNAATLDDILVNSSNTQADAVYSVSVTAPGYSCPAGPFLLTVPVNPQFNITDQMIDACLPATLSYDAIDLITGGTLPYIYTWIWNGTDIISTTSTIDNYPLTFNGTITLEVEDDMGCTANANLDITVYDEIFPNIVADFEEACQGNPAEISFTASLDNGQNINSSTWEILDTDMNVTSTGFAVGNDGYIIETAAVPPGEYLMQAMITDDNGCTAISNALPFTIYPTPFGQIDILQSGCETMLQFNFYDANGSDIYGHGPDSDFDGIPDIFDLDDNGFPDFFEITWTPPSSPPFTNNEITYTPLENGFYILEITTDQGCMHEIYSTEVTLSDQSNLEIVGPVEICENESVTLSIIDDNYNSIIWSDDTGILGTNTEVISVTPIFPSHSYYVETENNQACITRDTIDILVLAQPSIMIIGGLSICPGESTVIEVSTHQNDWTYIWLDDEDNVLPSIDSSSTISEAGTYHVIAANQNDCRDTLTFMIDQQDEINFDISGDHICDMISTTLDAGPGYESYSWFDLADNPLGVTQTITMDTAGTYIAEVAIGQCTGIDTIIISAYTTPHVAIVDTLHICNDNFNSPDTLVDLNLLVIENNDGSWMTDGTFDLNLSKLDSVSFATISAGNYDLIYTSNNAVYPCTNTSDTLTIVVSDCMCPDISLRDTILCNDVVLYDLDIQLNADVESGSWSFIDGPDDIDIDPTNHISLNNSTGGEYSFSYLLDHVPYSYCDSLDTLVIQLIEQSVLTIQENIFVCNSDSPTAPYLLDLDNLIIEGTGVWTDPLITGLDFSDPSNLDFTAVTPGSYMIGITSDTALPPCNEVEQVLTVEVLDCNCPPLALESPEDYCNDDASVDLSTLTGISAPGTWSVDQDNPSATSIINNAVSLSGQSQGTYQYIFTLDNPVDNCASADTISINLYDLPNVSIVTDTIVYNTNDVNLPTDIDLNDLIITGNGTWYDENGELVTDPANVDFSDEATGSIHMYSLFTEDPLSPCPLVVTTVTITVLDFECPVLDVTPSIDLCNDAASISLTNYNGNSADGSWSEDSNNPNINILNDDFVDLTNLASGTYLYIYTLTDAIENCADSDTLEVSLLSAPIILSAIDTTVCNFNDVNASTIINLNSLVNGDQGSWFDENGNMIADPEFVDFENEAIGSIHTFTYTTNAAIDPCVNIMQSITITVEDCNCDNPAFLNPPDLCNVEGQNIDLDDLLVSDHIGEWEYISGPDGESITITESTFDANNILPGNYQFTFTITENIQPDCQQSWPLIVSVTSSQNAQLVDNIEICNTDEEGNITIVDLTSLISSGSTSGYWTDANDDIVGSPTSVNFLGEDIGIYNYLYTVENDPPCEDISYPLNILVRDCSIVLEPTFDIYMPNVFSPNGDGNNDYLYPISNDDDILISQMMIYDRWGNNVFTNNNLLPNTPDQGWNGLYKDNKVVSGVYIYFAEILLPNGEVKVMSGDVLVVY